MHLDKSLNGTNFLQNGLLSKEELIATLEARMALLKAVVDNSPDFIYVKDLEGRYLMINPAGAAFFGKPVAEVLGRRADEFLSEGDAAEVKEAERKTYASDHPLTSELTYTLSGVTRTFLVIKGVYRNAAGEALGLFGISRDITERKRTEQEIADHREQLRFLASQLTTVEEQECRRIAEALHDQIGQPLALANIKLGSLTGTEDRNELRSNIKQIRELVGDAIRQTRSLTTKLSPPCLFDIGLEAALNSLADDIQKQHGLTINIRYDETIAQLPDDLRALLFHGIRELLVNIVKHARAERSDVSLERNGDFIVVTVEDNGIGFNYGERDTRSGKHQGFGLLHLRERLIYFGGCFDVTSVPGQYTRVTLVVPLTKDYR